MPPIYHVKRRLSDVSTLFPPEFEPHGSWWFPEKGTEFLTDQFAAHSKANMLGLHDSTPVGDDDLPQEVQVVFEADKSFTIPVYALSSPGKWLTEKNSDPSLTYEQTRVLTLTSAMRVLLEYIRIKKTLRDTTQMTQNRTLLAAERFDNPLSGSCAPIELLKQYVRLLMNQNQGRKPNRASCAIEVLDAIANTPDFLGRVRYTQIANADDLAKEPNGQARLLESMIGLPPGTLRLMDATYNAGTVANPSYKKFMGSDFAMGYVEPLGLQSWTMSTGWKWTGIGKDETAIVAVPQYTRGAVVVDELRIIAPTLPQIVRTELGVLITGCVDTTNTDYGGFLD